MLRKDSIPLFAKKLEEVKNIDSLSIESVLASISLKQAKSFFDKNILFIDARDDSYYNAGHIKGAIKNAFLMELVFNIEQQQEKSFPVVVYCGDPGCGDSEDLAYDLESSGFSKVYVFKGGWLEWSSAGYPVDKK